MSDLHQRRNPHRLYRDRENAIIAGVCAGVAEYFGFNRRGVRFITAIGAIFFLPFVVVSYIILTILLSLVLLTLYSAWPAQADAAEAALAELLDSIPLPGLATSSIDSVLFYNPEDTFPDAPGQDQADVRHQRQTPGFEPSPRRWRDSPLPIWERGWG